MNVSVIFTADWHLMENNPPCRSDNFLETQLNKIKQIKKLQRKYNCEVIHAGDLFEKARPSIFLVARLMKVLPDNFKTILGNHDIPEHNLELIDKSAVNLLQKAGKLQILKGNHYNTNTKEYYLLNDKKAAISHIMTWEGKVPWPGCTDPEINTFFDRYPEADIIVTGHNHKTMCVEKNNKYIINPGSLTRHKADQMNHRPCVFLYDSNTNTISPHYLSINDNVISREYIDIENKKEEKLQKFIDSIQHKNINKLSYEDNINILLNENKISTKIKQIIQGWLEHE